MERKDFITKGIVSGALLGASILTSASNATGNTNKQNDKRKMGRSSNGGGDHEEIIIEKSISPQYLLNKLAMSPLLHRNIWNNLRVLLMGPRRDSKF
jgi:hypothetical protein